MGACTDIKTSKNQGSSGPAASSSSEPGLPMLKVKGLLKAVKANSPLQVEVQYEEGWAINEQAPSRLTLLDGSEEIVQFDREELQDNRFEVPPISAGKVLHLQGTFYYCDKVKKSMCLVQSQQLLLSASDENTATKVSIDVR